MRNFIRNFPTMIYFGKGMIKHLPKICKDYDRFIVITGKKSSMDLGILEYIRKNIGDYIYYKVIESNPTIEMVDQATDLLRESYASLIIAIGGGSVIDVAKAMKVNYNLSKGELWKFFTKEKDLSKFPSIQNNGIDILAIPTISGSGSEVSPSCVISNPETKDKLSISHKCLIPKYAICDPNYLETVPIELMRFGIIDAICHCLEHYLNNEKDDWLIDDIALSIMNKLYSKISYAKYYEEDRYEIMMASILAMNGLLTIGRGHRGWLLHRIEHALSGLFPNIKHAEGLKLLFNSYIQELIYEYCMGNDAEPILSNKISRMRTYIGNETNGLRDFYIKLSDLELIADKVMKYYPQNNRDLILKILKRAF